MNIVGIRELKTHTSEIMRRVRERGGVIEISYHGEVIARLVPVSPPIPTAGAAAALIADLDRLAAEISAGWPDEVTATDAIRDARRDL